MDDERKNESERECGSFAEAAEGEAPGIVAEFIEFLRENRKWWLIPILVMLLGLGVLATFALSGAAPFIYPLF